MLKAGDGVLDFLCIRRSRPRAGRARHRFLAEHPRARSDQALLTLKLATVREDGEPTRRRELPRRVLGRGVAALSELAGYPNRLLVTATTEAGETYAEVAHEAISDAGTKLKEWIAAEREFLSWRSGLEAARRAWEKTADQDKNDALLMGFALTQAQTWLARLGAYRVSCWYGPMPMAPRIQFGGLAWSPHASRARLQPR